MKLVSKRNKEITAGIPCTPALSRLPSCVSVIGVAWHGVVPFLVVS